MTQGELVRKMIADLEAENTRLTRALDQRNEQIDGYEKQLGIIDAGAEQTIGSEIERLKDAIVGLSFKLGSAEDAALQSRDLIRRLIVSASQHGICDDLLVECKKLGAYP